jgi:hypothetical protein
LRVSPVLPGCYTILELYDLVGPSLDRILENLLIKKTDNISKDLQYSLEDIRRMIFAPFTAEWKKRYGVQHVAQLDPVTQPPTSYHPLFIMRSIPLKPGQPELKLFTFEPKFTNVLHSDIQRSAFFDLAEMSTQSGWEY